MHRERPARTPPGSADAPHALGTALWEPQARPDPAGAAGRRHQRPTTPGRCSAKVNRQRFPIATRERPRAGAMAGGEAGGGGDGGGGTARDVGRRAEAVGDLRDDHSGACEHGGAHSEPAEGRPRRKGHWFEALRGLRTFSSPTKPPQAATRWMAARGSTPEAKTALSRSHSVGAVESSEHSARQMTVHALGGGMVGGAGAHLLAVNEWVEGVLPACCAAASSKRAAAAAARRAGIRTSKSELRYLLTLESPCELCMADRRGSPGMQGRRDAERGG